MVTYTVPLTNSRDGASNPVGVVTADLQLDWLRRFIGDVKIGRTGYGVMVTRNGRVIAHPESSLLAVQLWTGRAIERSFDRSIPLPGGCSPRSTPRTS